MRIVFSAVLLFGVFPVVTGCASTVSPADMQKRQQALASSDHLIVPGERIGPVRLGMVSQEIRAILGEPDEKEITNDASGSAQWVSWSYWSLNLSLVFHVLNNPTPTVDSASTTDWQHKKPVITMFQTQHGIKLGSSPFDVKREYGGYQGWGGGPDAYWGTMDCPNIHFVITRTTLNEEFKVDSIQVLKRE